MIAPGTMEDVGGSVPVCDTCGTAGDGRTRDGDSCGACEDALAEGLAAQPARLPETTGGAC